MRSKVFVIPLPRSDILFDVWWHLLFAEVPHLHPEGHGDLHGQEEERSPPTHLRHCWGGIPGNDEWWQEPVYPDHVSWNINNQSVQSLSNISQGRVRCWEDGEYKEGHLLLRFHRSHRQEEGGRAWAWGQDSPDEPRPGGLGQRQDCQEWQLF